MKVIAIILIALGIILVLIIAFIALVGYLISAGMDSREKEAQELIKKNRKLFG